jgi:hypothetical protein
MKHSHAIQTWQYYGSGGSGSKVAKTIDGADGGTVFASGSISESGTGVNNMNPYTTTHTIIKT